VVDVCGGIILSCAIATARLSFEREAPKAPQIWFKVGSLNRTIIKYLYVLEVK